MASIQVVTDSACDLLTTTTEEHDVRVVPLTIRFGPEELVDRDELSGKEFWDRVITGPHMPATAAPSPGAFQAAFLEAHEAGKSAVVCATISSGLSATYQSAVTAAETVADRIPVRVVDTLSVTMGQGLLALAASDMAAAGASLDDIVAALEDMKGRTHVYGVVDSLDYLRRGGRIGGAAKLMGSLLSIKPVIEVREGVVEVESKQRTRARGHCSTWPTRPSTPGPSSGSAPAAGWRRISTSCSTCCARRAPTTSSSPASSGLSSGATPGRARWVCVSSPNRTDPGASAQAGRPGPATNLMPMEDQATNPSPASAPSGATATATPTVSQAEWPAKVADTIEDVVEAVQDRVVRPLILASRAVVFGVIIVVMALVLSVVVAIAIVRLLDVYAFGGRVWASDALFGAILVVGGAFAWTKRGARDAGDA